MTTSSVANTGSTASPSDFASLVDIFERQLVSLRMNVEQELVSGLRETIQKLIFDSLFNLAADADPTSSTWRLRQAATASTGTENGKEVDTVQMLRQISSNSSEDTLKQIRDDQEVSSNLSEETMFGIEPLPNSVCEDEQGAEQGLPHRRNSRIGLADENGLQNYGPSAGWARPRRDSTSSCETNMESTIAQALSKVSVVSTIVGPVSTDDKISKLVRSDIFDYCMSAVLVLNSIVIGQRADWEANNLGAPDLAAYVWIDRVFCVAFLAELFLRLYTYRLAFYTVGSWQWAYFDTTIVAFQVVEEVTFAAAGEATFAIGFLKILKLGRLLRMARMVRLLPELKSLVVLITASMSSFLWTCVLLLLLVYILAVYMVMMAVDSLEETIGEDSSSRMELQQYWGSVGSAALSLYWAISGGQDWAILIEPMNEQTGSQIHNIIFCMFIAFSTMVLMNLVTGVFVEGAARLSKEDRERELSRMCHKIFRMVDDDGSERLTRDEFDRHIILGNLDTYLIAVDLDSSAAANLFEILDTDKTNCISIDEFVDGCLRLNRNPRAADIAQVLIETRSADVKQKEWFDKLSSMVEQMRAEVKQLSQIQPKISRHTMQTPTALS